MPIYSYECDVCDTDVFERLVTIDERDHQCCRSCGRKLDRQIDRPGLVWKPSSSTGWSGLDI